MPSRRMDVAAFTVVPWTKAQVYVVLPSNIFKWLFRVEAFHVWEWNDARVGVDGGKVKSIDVIRDNPFDEVRSSKDLDQIGNGAARDAREAITEQF